jgi:MSHA biogenesis protein MshO
MLGFTLLELTMSIVIMAIIALAIIIFINGPILAYLANRQRAELTMDADACLRRMGRDLRLALPNSIRQTSSGSTQFVEMLQTRTGGRYRDQTTTSGQGDPLVFSGDSAFDTLGNLPWNGDSAIVVNADQVVIYNLGFDVANAYSGLNSATIQSVSAGALPSESHVTFNSTVFPLASPGNRFQVISGPASYVCAPGTVNSNGDATGTLTLWRNYTIQATEPTTAPSTGTNALLSNYVSACAFQYNPDPNGAQERGGLFSLQVSLTRAFETVTLSGEVHVNNLP